MASILTVKHRIFFNSATMSACWICVDYNQSHIQMWMTPATFPIFLRSFMRASKTLFASVKMGSEINYLKRFHV